MLDVKIEDTGEGVCRLLRIQKTTRKMKIHVQISTRETDQKSFRKQCYLEME